MRHYPHLREIAVLPCLPEGLSVEDAMLDKTAPSFGLEYAMPNAVLARVLSFLNISKRHYLDLVRARRGLDLASSKPQGTATGPWRHRGEYAADWRALAVDHDATMPQLLSDDEIVEIFDNASYGGQLAIAGYVDADLCLAQHFGSAVALTGRFQIGIVDYVWGSGHTVTWDGDLTVDLSHGQIGDAPGYSYDGVCDFVVDYFRFRSVARATLPAGYRWLGSRAAPRRIAA